jgi:hypothetical protein
LEAHGPSYRTDGIVHNRISALTGCPTIVGWRTHEWLWKDDIVAVDARADVVQEIYTCFDIRTAASYLSEYGVASDGSISSAASEKINEVFGLTVRNKLTKEAAITMLKMLRIDPEVCISKDKVETLLKEYNVEYLYVGYVEFLKYGDIVGSQGLDYDYLRSLGEVVYEGAKESEYYQTFIVKLN